MSGPLLYISVLALAVIAGIALQATGFVPWVFGKLPWSRR